MKIKTALFLSLVTLSVSVFAQQDGPRIPQKRRIPRSALMIEKVTEGRKVCIVNMQKDLTLPETEAMAASATKVLGLIFEIRDAQGKSAEQAAAQILTDKTIGSAVVLHDSATAPSILIAPEDGWSAINIGKLKIGADRKTLTSRAKKEFWRTLCFLMGGANATLPNCVMKTVQNVKDLDEIKIEMACPEFYGKIIDHSRKLGLAERRPVFYGQAVREGWAPAPTNDLQRTIWNRFHSK